MARDSDNANALVDSFVHVAPVGSTLPVDVTAALDPAFLDAGWLSDAGLGETFDTNTTAKRGINGAIVKTVKGSDDKSFTFECYERNAVTMGLIRPGSTPSTTTGLTTTNVKAYLGTDERAWVLEADFGTYTRRIGVSRGQAFVTGTVTDKPGDLAVLQFRLDTYPASDGTTYIDLTDNPAEAVA